MKLGNTQTIPSLGLEYREGRFTHTHSHVSNVVDGKIHYSRSDNIAGTTLLAVSPTMKNGFFQSIYFALI